MTRNIAEVTKRHEEEYVIVSARVPKKLYEQVKTKNLNISAITRNALYVALDQDIPASETDIESINFMIGIMSRELKDYIKECIDSKIDDLQTIINERFANLEEIIENRLKTLLSSAILTNQSTKDATPPNPTQGFDGVVEENTTNNKQITRNKIFSAIMRFYKQMKYNIPEEKKEQYIQQFSYQWNIHQNEIRAWLSKTDPNDLGIAVNNYVNTRLGD